MHGAHHFPVVSAGKGIAGRIDRQDIQHRGLVLSPNEGGESVQASVLSKGGNLFLAGKTGKVQIKYGIDFVIMRGGAGCSCDSGYFRLRHLSRLGCNRYIVIETVTQLNLKNTDFTFGYDSACLISFGRSRHKHVY